MFEDIIAQLDSLGVTYTEDYDDSRDVPVLIIDVANIDKAQLISIISIVNTSGFELDINENTLTVYGSNAPAVPAGEEDAQAVALDDMFAGGEM